ncbi:hypothetical protein MOUN0_N02476 [Monosporozyma unispora]|nr:hypothetical protein C6P44_001698 [Kazachstania unispora]
MTPSLDPSEYPYQIRIPLSMFGIPPLSERMGDLSMAQESDTSEARKKRNKKRNAKKKAKKRAGKEAEHAAQVTSNETSTSTELVVDNSIKEPTHWVISPIGG